MDNDGIRAGLDAVMQPHIDDEAARQVAVVLASAMRTVEVVYAAADVLTEDAKRSVLHLLTDFTLLLPDNMFWKEHAGYMIPVFATAVMTWLDGPSYAVRIGSTPSDAGVDAMVAMQACRGAIATVALAVLMRSEGNAAARDKSTALRDAIMGLEL